MMVYSYKEDKDLDDWMSEYAKDNNTYFMDQTRNFLHMKQDFEQLSGLPEFRDAKLMF